jgi:hypothetical protein
MPDYKVPPQKLIDIKNSDKGFTEKWTPSRSKDIGNFPHPSRIALIGPPSVGKSFICKHLLMHQKPMFKELYIIHGDADVTTEFDDLEPTMIMSDFPPLDFWDAKVKTLCIVDDVEYSNLSKEQMARLHKLVRYVSSHKNVSLYFTHQSFFELPNLVRKLCNVYILWKPRSSTELKLIASRIGLKQEMLSHVFEHTCNEYRDSLCVDLNINTPAHFRKNIFEPIDMKSQYDDRDVNYKI